MEENESINNNNDNNDDESNRNKRERDENRPFLTRQVKKSRTIERDSNKLVSSCISKINDGSQEEALEAAIVLRDALSSLSVEPPKDIEACRAFWLAILKSPYDNFRLKHKSVRNALLALLKIMVLEGPHEAITYYVQEVVARLKDFSMSINEEEQTQLHPYICLIYLLITNGTEFPRDLRTRNEILTEVFPFIKRALEKSLEPLESLSSSSGVDPSFYYQTNPFAENIRLLLKAVTHYALPVEAFSPHVELWFELCLRVLRLQLPPIGNSDTNILQRDLDTRNDGIWWKTKILAARALNKCLGYSAGEIWRSRNPSEVLTMIFNGMKASIPNKLFYHLVQVVEDIVENATLDISSVVEQNFKELTFEIIFQKLALDPYTEHLWEENPARFIKRTTFDPNEMYDPAEQCYELINLLYYKLRDTFLDAVIQFLKPVLENPSNDIHVRRKQYGGISLAMTVMRVIEISNPNSREKVMELWNYQKPYLRHPYGPLRARVSLTIGYCSNILKRADPRKFEELLSDFFPCLKDESPAVRDISLAALQEVIVYVKDKNKIITLLDENQEVLMRSIRNIRSPELLATLRSFIRNIGAPIAPRAKHLTDVILSMIETEVLQPNSKEAIEHSDELSLFYLDVFDVLLVLLNAIKSEPSIFQEVSDAIVDQLLSKYDFRNNSLFDYHDQIIKLIDSIVSEILIIPPVIWKCFEGALLDDWVEEISSPLSFMVLKDPETFWNSKEYLTNTVSFCQSCLTGEARDIYSIYPLIVRLCLSARIMQIKVKRKKATNRTIEGLLQFDTGIRNLITTLFESFSRYIDLESDRKQYTFACLAILYYSPSLINTMESVDKVVLGKMIDIINRILTKSRNTPIKMELKEVLFMGLSSILSLPVSKLPKQIHDHVKLYTDTCLKYVQDISKLKQEYLENGGKPPEKLTKQKSYKTRRTVAEMLEAWEQNEDLSEEDEDEDYSESEGDQFNYLAEDLIVFSHGFDEIVHFIDSFTASQENVNMMMGLLSYEQKEELNTLTEEAMRRKAPRSLVNQSLEVVCLNSNRYDLNRLPLDLIELVKYFARCNRIDVSQLK